MSDTAPARPTEPSTTPAAPVFDSQQSAAQALVALFMSNADAGNNAANDELIARMAERRIRKAD